MAISLLCRNLLEGLLNKLVVVFVIIIFIRTSVEWFNIVIGTHLSDWWQNNLDKSPVYCFDVSATINPDENLAERLVFKNHTRFVPLVRVASSLVLNANTRTHRL